MLADGGLTGTVQTGPLLVAAAVAALVGLIGFLSPCVLPLVPGYLSYVAGLSGDAERPSQRRMLLGALLFVSGFTAIFVAQGTLFGEFGFYIREHRRGIEQVFGVVTIVMGVVFLGGIGFLQRELKIHRRPRAGLVGAPLLGLGFGLAWTPCLTPTFSAVYSMSLVQGTAGRGALLTVFYCLGLGIPFLLVAAGFGWVASALGFVRKHRRAVSIAGGVLLVAIGILLVTGAWNELNIWLRTSVPADSGVQV
ncbi:cytochrome c-type biogenesis protein [Jatrophihabitans endophyticus]|uniref:Cytochrome c-type biogenesis protein n=1 Tax=Jatrophihabitans endophyticus TaxID=1206085 RepID=A0A1M5QYQ5_9ACTN|nr:cytochrome c biogenesis CcdA family protein [Jatrophihabitans endophyticus]SHH19285.1 cytochrome c-type biogenesis protein [Jatrophihabitans endophyticus]